MGIRPASASVFTAVVRRHGGGSCRAMARQWLGNFTGGTGGITSAESPAIRRLAWRLLGGNSPAGLTANRRQTGGGKILIHQGVKRACKKIPVDPPRSRSRARPHSRSGCGQVKLLAAVAVTVTVRSRPNSGHGHCAVMVNLRSGHGHGHGRDCGQGRGQSRDYWPVTSSAMARSRNLDLSRGRACLR